MTDPEGSDTIEYDALNRLKKVTRSASGLPDLIETYDYNSLGALKLNAGTALDTQRPRKSGGGSADAGVPASLDGQAVVLDSVGRITSMQGKTFAWNQRGWLLSATVAGVTRTYRQDAYGRLAVIDTSTPPVDNYIYDDVDGMNIIGVRRWAGASQPGSSRRLLQKLDNYLYDGVDHPLRLQHRLQVDATTFQTIYYELDLAGNVRRLRDPSGADLGGYRYTAFGKAYAADAATPEAQVDQPLRWKSRWFNASTELYDMRTRQWSPALGAFITTDRLHLLRSDTTLWGWPGQNPFKFADPLGQDGIVEAILPDAVQSWIIGNGKYFGPESMRAAESIALLSGQEELVPIFELGARAATVIDIVFAFDQVMSQGITTVERVGNDPNVNASREKGENEYTRAAKAAAGSKGDPIAELKKIRDKLAADGELKGEVKEKIDQAEKFLGQRNAAKRCK
jgi:RHS repeat-associated protein